MVFNQKCMFQDPPIDPPPLSKSGVWPTLSHLSPIFLFFKAIKMLKDQAASYELGP